MNVSGVSLVTATVDRVKELKTFIDSLVNQTTNMYELIIVDQNIDDRLVPIIEYAKKNNIDINHIKVNKRGLSYGRNIGIKNAKYDIVGIPDDDCWFENNTIEKVISFFIENTNFGCVSAFWPEKKLVEYEGLLVSKKNALKLNAFTNPSSQLFFKKSMFKIYGGFDERFGVGLYIAAGEEIEYVLRLITNNILIGISYNIIVHHNYPLTNFPLAKVRSRERYVGAVYLKYSMKNSVIIRGLLSPYDMFKRIKPIIALTKTIGRIEGMLYWYFKQKNEHVIIVDQKPIPY